MLTSTLRIVGGSVMMTIPKPVLDALGLAANEKVSLTIEDGRLVVGARPRPRYNLDDLLAQGDATASDEADAEGRAWMADRPVGREEI